MANNRIIWWSDVSAKLAENLRFDLNQSNSDIQSRIDEQLSSFIEHGNVTADMVRDELRFIAHELKQAGQDVDASRVETLSQSLDHFTIISSSHNFATWGEMANAITAATASMKFHTLSDNGDIVPLREDISTLTDAERVQFDIEQQSMGFISAIGEQYSEELKPYLSAVRIADTFDEDNAGEVQPIEHALDSWSFLVTDPLSNEEFLDFARAQDAVPERALDAYAFLKTGAANNSDFLALSLAAYEAEHGEGAWQAEIDTHIASLQDEIAYFEQQKQNGVNMMADVRIQALQEEIDNINPDAVLAEWGVQNNVIQNSPEFLTAAEADYNALHAPETWAEHVATRTAELTEAANSWSFSDLWDGDDGEKLANYDPQAELIAWAMDNDNIRTPGKLLETGMENLWKNEAFIKAAEENYDALNGEGAWAEHVATLRSELESLAQMRGPGASPYAQQALENFAPEKELAQWGIEHSRLIHGALDFSNAASFGLDPDIFRNLDQQNPVPDDTVADRNTPIGAAYLNAAEILYNERHGEGAWARHAAQNNWSAEEADKELAAYGEWSVGWLEDNITTALSAMATDSDTAKVSLLYLQHLNAHKESSWGDVGAMFARGAVDPTMWVGIGSGGAALGARFAAQVAVKKGVQTILTSTMRNRTSSMILGTMTAGLIEGALSEAALATIEQKLGMDVDIRKEYDFGTIAMRSGMGAVFGSVFGGALGGAGHLIAKSISFSSASRALKVGDFDSRSADFKQFVSLLDNAEAAAVQLRDIDAPTPAQLKEFNDATQAILNFDAKDISAGELAALQDVHGQMLARIDTIAAEHNLNAAPSGAVDVTVDAPELDATIAPDATTTAPVVDTTPPADLSAAVIANADTTTTPDIIASADATPANRVAPEQVEVPVSETIVSADVTTNTPVIDPTTFKAAYDRVRTGLQSLADRLPFTLEVDYAGMRNSTPSMLGFLDNVRIRAKKRTSDKGLTSAAAIADADQAITAAHNQLQKNIGALTADPNTSLTDIEARIDTFMTTELDAIRTQATEAAPEGLLAGDTKALNDEIAGLRATKDELLDNARTTLNEQTPNLNPKPTQAVDADPTPSIEPTPVPRTEPDMSVDELVGNIEDNMAEALEALATRIKNAQGKNNVIRETELAYKDFDAAFVAAQESVNARTDLTPAAATKLEDVLSNYSMVSRDANLWPAHLRPETTSRIEIPTANDSNIKTEEVLTAPDARANTMADIRLGVSDAITRAKNDFAQTGDADHPTTMLVTNLERIRNSVRADESMPSADRNILVNEIQQQIDGAETIIRGTEAPGRVSVANADVAAQRQLIEEIRLGITNAISDAKDRFAESGRPYERADELAKSLTLIRNTVRKDTTLPPEARNALVNDIQAQIDDAYNLVQGTTAPRPGPSTRVEDPAPAPRPHVEGEEPTAPKPRAEGDPEAPKPRAEDGKVRPDTYFHDIENRVGGGVTEDIAIRSLEITQAGSKAKVGSHGNSRSVAHFHDNIRDTFAKYDTALRKGKDAEGDEIDAETAHTVFQNEILELHQSLSRMGGLRVNKEGKIDPLGNTPNEFKLSPDGSTYTFGTYETGANITSLQKDGLRTTLDKALDLGDELRRISVEGDENGLKGAEAITAYMKEVAYRAQNVADIQGGRRDPQTAYGALDAFILAGWKHGKNTGTSDGYEIGKTNISQTRQLRYIIEEAGDLYRRETGPTPFGVGNAENEGGRLRKLIGTAEESAKNPDILDFSGNFPPKEKAAERIVSAIKQGLTTSDLIAELNSAVARTKKANPFINFNKILEEMEKLLATERKVNGEIVESITHADGRIEITDPEVAPLLKRLRMQNELVWEKSNQGLSYDSLLYGKVSDGTLTQDDRQMRDFAQASLNIKNSPLRYSVNPTGAPSAAGDSLKKARRTRIPATTANILFGKKLDLQATRESILASGGQFENVFHPLKPEGGIQGKWQRARYMLGRTYGLMGGYYLPNAVKMMPDHWGKNIQLLKRGHGIRAAHLAGAAVPLAMAYSIDAATEAYFGEDSWVATLSPFNGITNLTGTASGTLWNVTGGAVGLPTTDAGFYATPETTTPPAPVTTTGEEVPVVDVSNTNEAIKIRQWAGQHRDDDALKLPNEWGDADEQYIESIVLKAAELLKANPSAYPGVRWSTVSNDNDFTQVWNAARDEVNAGLRNNLVKEAAMKAYAALTGREATYNFAGDEALNFDKVVGWLQANTDNIAPINADTLMPTDPWAINSAAFTAAVKAHEDSLAPEAIKARKDAALAGFAADRGVPVLALNAAEKEAAIILSNAFKTPEIGLFYTAEELSGDNDASKALRSSTLADVNATIEQRAQEAAIEAAKQARIQAALIGYANDKGSGLEGLTQAEKDAAAMMAETKDASGAFHSDAYLSGIAGRAKRQSLLTEAVTAAAETARRQNSSNPLNNIDLALTGQQTMQAGENVVNWLTDTDNDGYSALIDTDWGRALSGSLQQAGGAVTNLWGNLNQTEGGRQTIGIGAGIITALALPSLVRNIPILKNIANIPFVGGLLFAAIGFFAATKGVDALYKNGSLFDPITGANNTGADADADDDGDRTDTESGDVQGEGGYVDPNAVGHTIRTQPHDGGLPQIITVEGDFDDDPETKEVLSFFDLDGDGQYAAQMARDGETISFAAPEILSGEKLQGALSFIDNIARAKAEATGDIKIEAVANSGDPAVMTLTINGEEYALDHKLETPLDNPYLSQSLETQ